MLRQELDERYNILSAEEEYSRWMILDIFLLDGIMMTIVMAILLWHQAVAATIIGGILIGSLYLGMKERKKRNFVKDKKFMDLMIYCSDGCVSYQIVVERYKLLQDGELILINNTFMLDTTTLFKDGYDIYKNILSYLDDSVVLTKYGVGNAPNVCIITTYDGEYGLDEKSIPILMLRETASVLMELSK